MASDSAPATKPAAPPAARISAVARTGVDIFAGLCAGVGVTLVGHPFETIKVRLQTQPSGKDAIYSGFIDAVRKTLKWEGPAGLYAGVAAPLAGQLFFRSATFWSNAFFTQLISRDGTRRMSYLDFAIAGSAAWAVSTLIECPLQLTSSQLQVEALRARTIPGYSRSYSGVADFLRKEVGRRGVGVLYTGLLPQLTRNCVGGFFHFGLFEVIRREVAKARGVPVESVGLATNMIAGSVGGFFYWLLTYPVDVVKSAIQGDALDPQTKKYRGMLDTFQKLYAEGGAMRFTKGMSACLLRALPANAVLLTTAFRVKEMGYAYAAQNNW